VRNAWPKRYFYLSMLAFFEAIIDRGYFKSYIDLVFLS